MTALIPYAAGAIDVAVLLSLAVASGVSLLLDLFRAFRRAGAHAAGVRHGG